jgi:hypothetical protein
MKEDRTIPCPYKGDYILKIILSKVKLLLFNIFNSFISQQGLFNPLVKVS